MRCGARVGCCLYAYPDCSFKLLGVVVSVVVVKERFVERGAKPENSPGPAPQKYPAIAILVLHLSPKQPPPILFSPLSAPNFLHPFSTHRFRRRQQKTPISSSFKDGSSGSSRSPSETECPVPLEQQPINEYQNLSTSFPFSWAALDFVEYASRLFVVGASFALFVGLPVAWSGAVGAQSEPLKPILAALSSGILVVSFAVVRMYLGWAYVGNRLLSATVEYEETGWYDGQIWVKTAEVLARDRLLGSFSVKPVLSRLKYTLVTLAASLFVCVLVFTNVEASQKASFNVSENAGSRAIPGSYSDDSARSFEPDAFCGEPGATEL